MAKVSRENVLVVDDDPDIRQAIAETLREEGFEVWEAANGEAGLDRLREMPKPCLVLLDLMMPIMDGNEFLEKVRSSSDPETAAVDVVIVTAAPTVSRDTARMARACLNKPFELHQLLEAVHARRS